MVAGATRRAVRARDTSSGGRSGVGFMPATPMPARTAKARSPRRDPRSRGTLPLVSRQGARALARFERSRALGVAASRGSAVAGGAPLSATPPSGCATAGPPMANRRRERAPCRVERNGEAAAESGNGWSRLNAQSATWRATALPLARPTSSGASASARPGLAAPRSASSRATARRSAPRRVCRDRACRRAHARSTPAREIDRPPTGRSRARRCALLSRARHSLHRHSELLREQRGRNRRDRPLEKSRTPSGST